MPRLTLSVRNHFLKVLGNGHSVAIAARHAGVSRNALYVRRRRDPHFAMAWDAMRARGQGLRLADAISDAPPPPTLAGTATTVAYAGDPVGTIVRKRSHSLLRLLTRLDALHAAAARDVGNGAAKPQLAVISSGVFHHPVSSFERGNLHNVARM